MSEQAEKQFSIQKIYTRNISFEAPNSPEMFTQEFQPQLDVDLNVETSNLEEGVYHAVVRVTATTKVGEKTAFLCEVEQAGIFTITGFGEDELGYLLATQCPNALFPYAREAISEMVTRGGFPQLLLEPVNFDAMYANHLQQQGNAPASETQQ